MTSPPQSLRPARIITPAIRQRLQERLTQARKLSRAEPCPHAQIDELLCECVIVDSGNTAYIGALLHHLRRSDRPRRTEFIPFWRRFFGQERNEFGSTLSHAAAAENWEEVLAVGPPLLCHQPRSVEILHHLAMACASLEHEQAELCYLQTAAAIAPSDAKTQRQLARTLTRQGLFDDAATAWKRLAEMLPEDEECRQTIKIFCEYQPPANAPGLLADDQQREIRSAIQSGSASIEQFRQLVHHLSNSRTLDKAEQVLDQATTLHGATLQLLDWREHLAMVRGWTAMEIADDLQTLQQEYAQLPQRKRDESNRIDLQIYGRRSERYPDDLRLQLQLGRLLNANGNYSEAIKRLEHIAGIEEHRAQALAELGRSWEKLKQREKAMACYQEAIDLARSQGDVETERKALRNAARVAERNGDNESARRYYARLLEFPVNCDLDRTYQELYQRMLDNLDDVCHNL